MMKRAFTLILTIIMFVVMTVPTAAQNTPVVEDDISRIIINEDGSYIVISAPKIVDTAQPAAYGETKTVVGNIDATCHKSNGDLCWIYTLHGTFTYVEGVSSTCIGASYDYTIYKNAWSFSDGRVAVAGDAAFGYGTFTKKVLFITTDITDIDIYVACDIYGNLY